MKRNAVTALVRERAVRFGDANPQQVHQLQMRFAKLDPTEVMHGLLQVFTTGEPGPQSSAAQELAGRLLATCQSAVLLDIQSLVREALPRYELSVEQFPWFLAKVNGAAPVLAALTDLGAEELSPRERRALETMAYWTRGTPSNAQSHEA